MITLGIILMITLGIILMIILGLSWDYPDNNILIRKQFYAGQPGSAVPSN